MTTAMDAATDQAPLQDLPQGVHLILVVGDERQRVLGTVQLDRRARSLEIVPLGDFFPRLVDRVVDFLQVHARRDVERNEVRHTVSNISGVRAP